jgi:Uncharacterized protein conserved in bacteria (DUF2325)
VKGVCCGSVTPLSWAGGSRRRGLWELGTHAHCPVVGVCLPLTVLRRIAGKVLHDELVADDYELHCGIVNQCRVRAPLSEAIGRWLDEHHAAAVRRAALCRDEAALATWWDEHSTGAGLPAALWAVLTHARCTQRLESLVLGELHMRQHKVGFAEREHAAQIQRMENDLAAAQAAHQKALARGAQHAAQHEAQCLRWQAEVANLRGLLQASEAALAELRRLTTTQSTPMAAAAQPQPDVAAARAREELAACKALRRALTSVVPEKAPAKVSDVVAATPAVLPDLSEQAVLCVGGRTAVVPLYRRVVEGCGARFEHHDGGSESSPHRLQSCLGAADLVICQTGCISHEAYGRVKEHCKRTGKRCVFIETPSVGGLKRALAQACISA